MRDEQSPETRERPNTERAGLPAGRGAGLSALGDFFRSLPDRLRRPESLLMIMALLASVGAHLPPYIGLGALADYFEHQEAEDAKKQKMAPVEVSFEVAEPAPPAPEHPIDKAPDHPEKVQEKPKPEEKKAEAEPQPEPQKLPPPPEPEKPKVAVSEVQLPEPPPPPPQQERKQSITQKSEDPNVEPPPDAKYLAEENRRVAEETVASVTSETRDDPEPQASAPMSANAPEKAGEDLEKDERGADEGAETDEPPQVASVQQQPQQQATPTPPPTPAQSARQEITGREAVKQQQEAAPTVVHDPLGSFVLAPAVPQKEAREGKEGQRGKAAATGTNLRVSWRAFEDTFGAQQLAQDRLPREAKRRGAGREKRWEEFRAAIENYIVGVKPGNQTAMNALADPFAAYLAAFHRNLHMEFAHDFLESLPALGELGNPDLVTKVEIVVNADGTLDRVGVVKSSGNLMYDFGAFNAVQRGAPYPPPPEKIRSTDGRVYMRWALHRNESQCGTWNAEPYILKNPPRSPTDPKPDGVSPFREGGGGQDQRENKVPPGSAPRAGETLGLNDRRTPVVSGQRS